VKQRVAEQVKTAAIKNYRIELDESAERDDGSIFSDHEVRAALVKKGFENVELEWMRCSQGRKDCAHRAAHRPALHGHAPRNLPDASGAGRGRGQDL
jgi:hypothetical protein